jgi:hypothetical protein
LTAFRAISAAKAEPDTVASAVANKTNFFMTIPTSAKNQSDTGAPQGKRQPTAAKFVTWQQCGTRRPFAESKKDKQVPTFWALRPFWEML